jgi:molecular chaperone GrpE
MNPGRGAPWEPSKTPRRPGGGDQRPAGWPGRAPTPGSNFGSDVGGGARVVDQDVVDVEVVEDEDGAVEVVEGEGEAGERETTAGGGGGVGPDAAASGDAGSDAAPVGDAPIEAVTKQRDDYLNALIQLQADFENYKKRIIKQQTDHLERAAEGLVEKLLPVLDTGDLALAHGGGEDVKQIMGALTSILEREGLERIDPPGGPFDPTLHDAVAHEPGDGTEQEVAQVLRAGYRWKGRVLRPAMVRVRG